MNDAERPRRAELPDDDSGLADAARAGADDVESTVVRNTPFVMDDAVFRPTAQPSHEPSDPQRAAAISNWFRDVPGASPSPGNADSTAPSPGGASNATESGTDETTTRPRATRLVPEHAATDREAGSDTHRRHLRSSILLTLASAVLPGSGLLGAPSRALKVLGALTSLLALGSVGFVAYRALTDLAGVARFAGNESVLNMASVGLIIVAIVWVALIGLTHVVTRPTPIRGGRRLLGAAVVTALAFGVAAPTAVAARYSHDTSSALDLILKGKDEVKANNQPTIAAGSDPWADQARVNILLLGGDGDSTRKEMVEKYSIRTDTIMVASIDTKTGDTTLIQIPRNVQYTPFPEGSEMAEAFPRGFRGDGDEEEWFINTIWQHVELDYPDLMAGSTYRGADALKEGVEGVTGLKINQFVMLNINGLQSLIDAMGGVTVNINREPNTSIENTLAIGGDTAKGIKPSEYMSAGPNQHLNGYYGTWYARSRWNTSDYSRMTRQSCLINAIVDQANPQTLLTNFEPIVKASADMLATDITDDQLSAYIDLAFRVKDKGTIKRLVFTNGTNGYSYADPDFDKMREAVAEAIEPKPAAATSPSTSAPSAPPSKKKTPSASASKSADSNEGVHNVADACAWQG